MLTKYNFFQLTNCIVWGATKRSNDLEEKGSKGQKRPKKLGILEKVQEVGPERFLSPAPLEEESEIEDCEVLPLNQDWDELIDIKPGTLTVSRGMRATRHESDLFGELKVKIFFFHIFKFFGFRSSFGVLTS